MNIKCIHVLSPVGSFSLSNSLSPHALAKIQYGSKASFYRIPLCTFSNEKKIKRKVEDYIWLSTLGNNPFSTLFQHLNITFKQRIDSF